MENLLLTVSIINILFTLIISLHLLQLNKQIRIAMINNIKHNKYISDIEDILKRQSEEIYALKKRK